MGRASNKLLAAATLAPQRRAVAQNPAPILEEMVVETPSIRTDMIRPQGPTDAMRRGNIIIPRTQQEIEATIARWRRAGAQPIAHDLECAASPTVPNGTGLHPHLGTIRLAQFAVKDRGDGVPEALVIDCWRLDPSEAVKLLAEPEWPTIIHFAQMETRWIGYKYGVRIENLIDTHLGSKLIYERHGFTAQPIQEDIERLRLDEERELKAIEEGKKLPKRRGPRFALGVVCQRELGLTLDKTQQNSYWDAVKLTDAQEKYAGEDVLSLLDLYDRFEPLWEDEDREALAKAARDLNDKTAGISEEEALRRLREENDETAAPYTPGNKGSEVERAVTMISSCQTKTELDKARHALPYMRLHFSDQPAIQEALRKKRRQLKRNKTVIKPSKVQVASWRQPF